MKKSLKEKRGQEKQRRLTLNRETIQVLDEPVLLELARGGQAIRTTGWTTSGVFQDTE